MGVMFSANAYHEYITTWEGVAHEHCGHDASIPSETGTLQVIVNETGNLEPYQMFEVELDVKNFTEALEEPFGGKVMLGIPGVGAEGVEIDNHLFSAPLGEHVLNRRESVDQWGSIDEDTKLESRGNPSPHDATFELIAPGTAGVYTLMGLAICGVNQSDDFAAPVADSEVNITYVEGTITVTVVAPAAPGPSTPEPTIPGFLTIILVSSITVTVFAVVLKVRRKKRIIE